MPLLILRCRTSGYYCVTANDMAPERGAKLRKLSGFRTCGNW